MEQYLSQGRNAYLYGLDETREKADFVIDGSKFAAFFHLLSFVKPPAEIIMWIWGWNPKFWAQVCKTAVIAGTASIYFLSLHNFFTASPAALNVME